MAAFGAMARPTVAADLTYPSSAKWRSHTISNQQVVERPKVESQVHRPLLFLLAITASRRRSLKTRLLCRAQAADAFVPNDSQDFVSSQSTTEDISIGDEASPAAEPEDTSTTQDFLAGLGLTPKQIWKVEKFWSISGERVPPVSRCQMVADYLQTDVGLASEQLARTIADCPEVLEVFSTETLKEKVRFLEVEVGIEDDLPEIIAAYPKVFCRPILTTLRPALEFWLDIAKVDPEDFPELLKTHGMQIWSRPKSLKPKLRFATEVMGLTVQKVLGSKTPFFRLSMVKIVAPRHFFALQQQKPGLDLDELVGSGDAAFCKTVGATLEEYKEWLQEWPYSEQARAVSWLEPKERSSSGGPRSQRRNFQNRRFEKKGRFSKGRGPRRDVPSNGRAPRRDVPNQSRNAGSKGRFQKADDWEERFSRAEL